MRQDVLGVEEEWNWVPHATQIGREEERKSSGSADIAVVIWDTMGSKIRHGWTK
jgi:F420-0:gamma-glutamyl ligase